MIEYLLGLIITVMYALGAFAVAQKSNKSYLWFYLMIYAPYALGILFLIFISVVQLSGFMIFIAILIIIEKIFWGMALKEAAGRDQLIWFFIIWLFPVVGWLLYYITKLA